MDAIMAPLYLWEVEIIQNLQTAFKNSSELMLFLTKLGDPRFAFLIYFPLAYFLNKQLGVQVMWIAAVSEWLNGLLKWLLYGHRPYWWVHESGMFTDVPHLEQHRLTCETGPGSPSGHAMVTAAVWYAIIKAFNVSQTKHRSFWSICSWSFFLTLMSSVMVSRCFIATHFPHQVLFGCIAGIIVGELVLRCSPSSLTFKTYVIASATLIICAVFIHWFLDATVGGTMWSIELAMKRCDKREWIHPDTTPYFAFTRDSSSLLGIGLAQQLTRDQKEFNRSLRRKVGEVLIAIGLTIVTESMRLPQEPMALFYFLSFIKYTMLPCSLLVIVPRIGQCLDVASSYQKKDQKID